MVVVLVHTVDTDCAVADTASTVVVVPEVTDEDTDERVVDPVHDDVIAVGTSISGKDVDSVKLSVDTDESEVTDACEFVSIVAATNTTELLVV